MSCSSNPACFDIDSALLESLAILFLLPAVTKTHHKNVLALTLGPAEFFMFACLSWHLNFLRNVCVRPQPPSRLCPLLLSPGIKDGCKCLIDGWEYLGAKECNMSKIDAQAEWLISEGKILSCRPPGFPTLSGLLQGRRSSHLLLENYLKPLAGLAGWKLQRTLVSLCDYLPWYCCHRFGGIE